MGVVFVNRCYDREDELSDSIRSRVLTELQMGHRDHYEAYNK